MTGHRVASIALLSLLLGCSGRDHLVVPSADDSPAMAPSTEQIVDDPGGMALPQYSLGGAFDDDSPRGPASIPNQLIVHLAPGTSTAAFCEEWGVEVVAEMNESSATLVAVGNSQLRKLASDMQLDHDCDYAEPNYVTESPEGTHGTVPFYEANHVFSDVIDQDALVRIDAPAAQSSVTGQGVIVAIIDTGVDATHPDLAGRILPGYDFVSNDADAQDERTYLDEDQDGLVDEGAGHGTHIAGLVLAVAPNAQILPVRVLDSEGAGTSFGVAQGIRWAAAQGADVINLSLGMYTSSEVIKDAIEDASEQGIILVSAAGNAGFEAEEHFPSKIHRVIGVGATDPNDERAGFSNFGSDVDVAAPGVGLLSTFLDHGYAVWSGTSMATPLVSGAVALRLEFAPATQRDDFLDGIEETAAPIVGEYGTPWEGKLGEGRLSASVATVNVSDD